MRKLKLQPFTHWIIPATTPSLLAYPEQPLPQQAMPQTVGGWGSQEKGEKWVHPTTYDEIMGMLKDLE